MNHRPICSASIELRLPLYFEISDSLEALWVDFAKNLLVEKKMIEELREDFFIKDDFKRLKLTSKIIVRKYWPEIDSIELA